MGLQKFRADKPGDAQKDGSVPWFTSWQGGPTLALLRKCPIPGLDVSPRTVYIRGEADTFFSIPAACQIRGKVVRGYVSNDAGEYVFHPYKG